MSISKYQFRSILVMFLLVLLAVTKVSAQTNMTKIKDASVSGSSAEPFAGAVLELESNTKGFLAPRMTTGQRDAIPVANRTDGLLIFNTTTNCFNYWTATMATWLSICGTPPPAVMDLTCAEIKVNGDLMQGVGLNANNFISIPVNVQQPGTYEVVASTENGYYFTTSGSFPNAGKYTLYLPGFGTPRNGYAPNDNGDLVTIKVHGKPLNNCEVYSFVENAHVDYELDCATLSTEGDFMIGIALGTANKLKLTVEVVNPGYWSMWTNTVNGYSFSGTGNFETIGRHEVILTSSGTPVASGTDNFILSSNSDNLVKVCNNLSVVVRPVAYEMLCSEAVINGMYMQDVALNSSNTITLPINVTATGIATITTNTVNGISFTSGQVSFSSLGKQNITLQGTGTPSSGVSTQFTLTGSLGATATCVLDLPVAAQPVAYTMSCSTIAVQGSYAPKVPMTANNKMTLEVTANYAGAWSITTDEVNGVIFKGSGTLTVGQNTLTLQAIGTPVVGGIHEYALTSNSSSGSVSCSYKVTYLYRTMRILGLGSGAYQPGTAATSEASRAIITSSSNFGPKGVVKVENFVIVNGGTGQGNTLRNNINNNNIDIIIIGYNYLPNAASRDILDDFVKNKKGVLIHSQENDASGAANLINKISGGSVSVSATGRTYYNPTFNVDDPLLNGAFGDMRSKAMGADVNNSYYVQGGLPSNLIALSSSNDDVSKVHFLRHNTLGYVYIGDSGWSAGNSTNSSTTIWPAVITSTGVPLSKSYSGGVVFNSFYYANTVAWAIKYVQENIQETYMIPSTFGD